MTQNKMYFKRESKSNYVNSYSQLAASTQPDAAVSSGYLGTQKWVSKIIESLAKKAEKPARKGWAKITLDQIGTGE
ncbi:MAG TPA: hypothetical protein VJ110_03450 [Candidatus Nanoarchaeia archaeon]|nr:hypothetical protein [Candidatus Nanoarchaeia archaeon]